MVPHNASDTTDVPKTTDDPNTMPSDTTDVPNTTDDSEKTNPTGGSPKTTAANNPTRIVTDTPTDQSSETTPAATTLVPPSTTSSGYSRFVTSKYLLPLLMIVIALNNDQFNR
ncbi:unnamed protein product [Diabrotica balteata]|uniref:Uncharacterized protein n=1 Tax=Diabrotica balteata TaxID=107213 RepID=A0A9N9XHK0_DIABA|nr:unnamed protein product [Diabrotica balteata]